ncbi:hypothetical protein MHU86_12118 [Fragilaria crotonensis]|nr:hypothetical protein MHU86_12118 [Fragilaria crotonensis]
MLKQPPPRHGPTGYSPTLGHSPSPRMEVIHPPGASLHSDVDQQISRLRKANTPTHLRGRDRKSVTVFYNSFVDFHKIYRVPFKILDDLRIDKLDDVTQERLHPADLLEDPTLYDRYSSAIYARLEEDGVLDPSDQLYQGLLQMYNSKRDGYRLLQDILATTLLVPSKNIGQLSTPPTVQQGTTPYDFAWQLKEFYACQLQHNRTYTVREQATMFLQGMQHATPFTHAATQLLHDMHQLPEGVPLPLRLAFPNNLPLTLLTSAETMRSHSSTSATINVTRSTPRTVDDRNSHDRDRSRERRPGYDRRPPRDSSVGRESSAGRSTRSTPQRPLSTTAAPRPTARNPDVQCAACATNGHTALDCRQLPKIAACMEYITAHPTEANSTLRQYRRAQHPEHRRMARDRIINVLQTRLQQGTLEDDDEDIEAIVDQLTGDYSDDDYIAPIFHLRAETPQTLPDSHWMAQMSVPTLRTEEICTSIHPVKYPDISEFMDTKRLNRIRYPIQQENIVVQPLNVTRISPRLDTRRDLADTGASVSATGLLSILHQFTADTLYEIMGYDGAVTKAAGQGIALVHQATTGKTEPMLFVYVPTITGTIISLEHHARTHPAIHRWVQEATPSQNSGWVTFYDANGDKVSSYPTIMDKGLYYIQDMIFIPTTTNTSGPTEHINMTSHHPAETTPPPSFLDDVTVHTTNPSTPLNCVDYDQSLVVEHTQSMLRQDIPTNPICTDYNPPQPKQIWISSILTSAELPSDTNLGKMEKDVLNFEVWHQRFAHCSEKRLRLTQKHVDGIPKFHHATIPHIVACRACDVAKLRKAPRGPAATAFPSMEKGQVFHLDIGFIRGPANLPEVLARTQDAEPKVIESRQGYVCYLLIIDSKTRYGWPFPMKSKSVPPTLIRTFLTTHGNHTAAHRRIRTDGEGSLAESTVFRSLVAELGYTLEKTATDSSSQNGIAERPHQTLATMVRCLLYASSLPTPFWADALVYASYVNNRLYNSGINAVPYTQWTGRRANVKHLRAFGAHVSVKRSGNRPTKTDPHYYNGRFLRFGATERNIIYYDTVTKRDKTARHCKLDEFHYGSPPSERPHGAQHLLSQVLPRYNPLSPPLDNPKDMPLDEFEPHSDIPLPIDAIHETLDAQPTTAVAAQLLAHQQHQAILHLDMSKDMYGKPITLTIPINRLPTLGFIVHMDTTTGQLFIKGCQDGTFCSRIPRWRSTIRNSVVRSLNSTRVRSRTHMVQLIQESRSQGRAHVTLILAKIAVRTNDDDEIPQLHFDQLRHLNQLHIALRAPTNEVNDAFLNYTRAQLRKRPDYNEWRQSEWQQHNKFALQNMFGKPIPRPDHAIVLPFVWNYSIKEDPITGVPKRKARGTCNGGKRYGKAVTVAETYATCVEQPACRLYWAVTASEGLLAMGADAGNAFAEAPPPEEPFFMKIDDQYMEWWIEHLGNDPIPPGFVLPVNHALQGHPEASRLWETHIHGIIVDKLHFTPTSTHEKCLYSKRDPDGNNLQMILRQVDDFSVSADSQDQCQQTIATIGSYLQVPLNDLGIIRKFNGVNVLQTRWYIKISCEDYILKILLHHNWQDLKASNLPIPMRQDCKYQRELELAIRPDSPHAQQQVQNQAGFSYRMTIGELIYALVVARVDISFSIIKLSQYSASPASIHYQAVRHVFAFLNNTRTDGLIFWRKTPRNDLPLSDIPAPRSNPQDRLPTPCTAPNRLLAYSDSDWGSDASHRRSVTGTIILLSGAAVLYSTKYQKAVALSSTEAEFVAASDTGKTAIYMRTILSDLGFSQDNPTQLLIDNTGAVFMIDAQAPTKRTRHVDIRYFALFTME